LQRKTRKGNEMGKLDGKVAVITGGASGIGEASVRLFVEEGARVVVADIQDDKGHALTEELGAGATTFVHSDVTEESQIKDAIGAATERFGRLDCMFNNAGVPGVQGRIEEIDADAYDKSMAILLRGVFLGMKHAAPVMKAQGSGSIINTSSVAGLRAGGMHVYGTAKAAVIYLTRSVAAELGEDGIRVNCICPGIIITPIWNAMGLPEESWQVLAGQLREGMARAQPITRTGTPEDIARAALWLASDDSSYVTGDALVVDGGLAAGPSWSQLEQRRSGMAEVFSQSASS
jgi:NAD(P)-dependent dehydrogenase (short-subunit alcohol dehydrogenase family)